MLKMSWKTVKQNNRIDLCLCVLSVCLIVVAHTPITATNATTYSLIWVSISQPMRSIVSKGRLLKNMKLRWSPANHLG